MKGCAIFSVLLLSLVEIATLYEAESMIPFSTVQIYDNSYLYIFEYCAKLLKIIMNPGAKDTKKVQLMQNNRFRNEQK